MVRLIESAEKLTGKAEREFADRNLSDEDLIKALYQIVVNRQYDTEGLNYWIYMYGEYLNEFGGDKYEAKKTLVLRMAYEMVAPGYVISPEEGGIVFDLSQRLSSSMSVESFSVKNTNPEQQKKDLKEESSDGVRWLSKDEMINGHIYEIESKIYDTDTQETITFINSFKYIDKNIAYNPKVSMTKFDPYRMATQDVIFDFSECRELIDNSNSLDLEILNSDLTRAEIDSVFINKNNLVRDGYKYTLSRAASLFKPNKDYIVRLHSDGITWDKMISCSLKGSPVISETKPINANFQYDDSQKVFSFMPTNFGIFTRYEDWKHTYRNFILSNSKKGLAPVEVTDASNDTRITVPREYYGTGIPSDIRVYYTDRYTGALLTEFLFQVTFRNGDPPLIWTGIRYDA